MPESRPAVVSTSPVSAVRRNGTNTAPYGNGPQDGRREGSWTRRQTGATLMVLRVLNRKASLMLIITKASEASWSYSCDSKVSFDRVQILTPDFSGRRLPPPLPSPPLPSPPLPSPPPPPLSPPPLSPLPSPPPLSSSLSSSHLPSLPPSLPPSLLFASSTPSCRRSLACG